MIRGYEDIFVGSVSLLLGFLLVAAAATNWTWFYSLRSARFFETRFGRAATRLFHATLGVALIAWGVVITMGIRLGFAP